MSEKLFREPDLSFEKAARRFIDEDPSKWVDNVIEAFLERYPFLQEEPILVDWKRQDKTKGYAVGVIKVLDGQVPIIIRDFMLYPMDIFVYKNTYLPLNEATVAMLMESPEAFDGIAKAPSDSNTALFDPELTDSSFSPAEGGRNGTMSSGISTIRPARKYASVIEQISTVDKDKVRSIIQDISKDASVKSNFEKNGTLHILQKLANKTNNSASSSLDSYLRNLDIDRQYTYRDDFGNAYLKQANSNLDKTWTTKISSLEIKDYPTLCSKEKLASAQDLRFSTLPVVDSDKYLRLYEDDSWDYSDRFDEEKTANYTDLSEKTPQKGDYGVFFAENGVTDPFTIVNIKKSHAYLEKSASIDKIAGFNILGDNRSLVFDSQGNWEILNKQVEKTADWDFTESNFPKLGDFGSFITKEGATEPFEVRKVRKVANHPYVYVEGLCGLEKVAYYMLNKGAGDGIRKHESASNSFYIDKTANFVSLKGNVKLSDVWDKKTAEQGDIVITGDFGYKTAEFHVYRDKSNNTIEKRGAYGYNVHNDAKFVELSTKFEKHATKLVDPAKINQHYVGKDDAGLFYLKGRNFEKNASEQFELQNLSEHDVTWKAIHCGATSGDIKKIANLRKNEIFPLQGVIKSPLKLKDVSNTVKTAFDKQSGEIPQLSIDFVKKASLLQDDASVDAVLSLGLINKNNIVEYVEALPTIESAMSTLAKLLLMARLGLAETPSDVVREAMEKLTTVSVILRRLKSNIKNIS